MVAFLLAAVAAAAPCISVTSERIHARDLLAVVPEFAALGPDLFIGYSPRPGLQRVFEADELRAILRRHGGPTDVSGGRVCAEWKMAALEPELLRMRAAEALGVSPTSLELLDWSRTPVPAEAHVVLQRHDLRLVADQEDTAMWKGHVRYGGNRRMDIWARIRVRLQYSRVVAKTDLRPGERIDAAQVQVESMTGLPEPQTATSVQDVAGKVLKRSVAAGSPILLTATAEPKAILRGDTVQVEVRCGAARIRFEGVAQAPASIGQTVAVKNSETAKIVRARVEAPGLAVLMLGSRNGGS